ncbi:MAG: DUF624 domain-containing protein [Bacilli bacterium]
MNFEKYINSRWYQLFNVLYKLVIISLLFFFFSTFTFYIFGIIASGIAAFIIIRSSNKDNDLPILLTFWLGFKKNYLKALKISLIIFVLAFILIFNTYYFYRLTIEAKSMYSFIALYLMIGLDIILFTATIMIMLVCVYFPYLKTFNTIKYSIIMLFAFPGAFFMLVGLIITFLILSYLFWYLIPLLIPGLFFFIVYIIYNSRLMRLVDEDGILPQDAFNYLNEFRAKIASKKKTKLRN